MKIGKPQIMDLSLMKQKNCKESNFLITLFNII